MAENFDCEICGYKNNDMISLCDHILIAHDGAFNFDEKEDELPSMSSIPFALAPADFDGDEMNIRFSFDPLLSLQSSGDPHYPIISVIPSKTYKLCARNSPTEIPQIPPFFKTTFLTCPLCPHTNFIDAYSLGEHVSVNHSSYNDQITLTQEQDQIQRHNNPTFPGFQVLELIGMILPLTINKFKQLATTSCPVCCHHFSLNIFKKVGTKNFLFTHYDLDDFDLHDDLIDDPHIHTDDEINYTQSIITYDDIHKDECQGNYQDNDQYDDETDSDDKSKHDDDDDSKDDDPKDDDSKYDDSKDDNSKDDDDIKNDNIESHDDTCYHTPTTYPIELACCGNVICHLCLEKILISGANLICPFCMHEHTYYKTQYITVYAPSTTNNSWEAWWKKDAKYDLLAGL